jgi:hypothetical protein
MKITILGAFTEGLIESFGADQVIVNVAGKVKNLIRRSDTRTWEKD